MSFEKISSPDQCGFRILFYFFSLGKILCLPWVVVIDRPGSLIEIKLMWVTIILYDVVPTHAGRQGGGVPWSCLAEFLVIDQGVLFGCFV